MLMNIYIYVQILVLNDLIQYYIYRKELVEIYLLYSGVGPKFLLSAVKLMPNDDVFLGAFCSNQCFFI